MPHPLAMESAEDLGERIAALAAQLHAATYELLVLLREYDASAAWHGVFASSAHWLHWRTGIALGAAREKVRVARALASLPLVSATMQRGAISYAKVRALTRVATAENEAALLDFAQAATAAHVERFVGAWRRVDRVTALRRAEARHAQRELSTWVDDDGMVVVRGRLAPEAGAVFQRALQAAADRLFHEGRVSGSAVEGIEPSTGAQRRADALVLLAEAALASDLTLRTSGERYQVLVHVTAGDRTAAKAGPAASVDTGYAAVDVSAETSRWLACDASVVPVLHSPDGAVVSVGRKTRTIPPSTRRALLNRDRHCRFPGCTARICDAHHVEHWVDGGGHGLENLVLLCRRHHRLVHEGGVDLVCDAEGATRVMRADGAVLERAPALPPPSAVVYETGDIAVWDGTPFDVAYAIDVLYAPGMEDREAGIAPAS